MLRHVLGIGLFWAIREAEWDIESYRHMEKVEKLCRFT